MIDFKTKPEQIPDPDPPPQTWWSHRVAGAPFLGLLPLLVRH
jgi:hypothetical protein